VHGNTGFAVPIRVHGSLGLDITPLLKAGRNSITVDVETDQTHGGLRNPLYLAGDFGVQLTSPVRLAVRPGTGPFQALDRNGMPYYAGEIEYEGEFSIDALPEGKVVLAPDFGIPFQDACEISVNAGPWHPLPWPPYEVLLEKDVLHLGRNRFRVRVLTSLLRAFEGQTFDIPSHAYRNLSAQAKP